MNPTSDKSDKSEPHTTRGGAASTTPRNERAPDEERSAADETAQLIAASATEPDPPAELQTSTQDAPVLNEDVAKETPKRGVGRSAALVTAGILLSRVAGVVRQRVQAHYFGTGPYADVLTAAFRLGNITQNLLGEGTLSATFIPIYAKLRAEGRTSEARQFALAAFGLLIVVTSVASVFGALLAPWLSFALVAGFDEARQEAAVPLLRILFPMTGLVVLSAWALGVLNAHRQFFLPYAAPVLWSLAQIAGMVAAGSFLLATGATLAAALAWSALVGAALQLVVLLPAARRNLGGLAPTWDLKNEHLRESVRRLPGAIAGRGVIQISGLIDTQLVSYLAAGDLAVFGYAQTIYLLPMALLGTGEAAATLPDLARDTAEQDAEKRNRAFRERVGQSLGRLTSLSVPASFALMVVGRDLTAVLVQTGKFSADATERVGALLVAYGFSLLANAAGRVLITASYALGDTRTPVRFAVYRVVVSALIALALMKPLGVLGVVIGAVVAGWVETIALGLRIQKNVGGLGLHHVKFWRAFAAGALSAAAGFGMRTFLPAAIADANVLTLPVGPLLNLAAFGVTFLLVAPAFGVADVRSLLRRRRS